MRRSTTATFAVAFGLGLVAAGCGQQLRAERDGRQLADDVCALSEATTAEDASDAVDGINNELDDLARRFGSVTQQDRRRIDENLSDLQKHVADGDQNLAQQDLAVIKRNAEQFDDGAGGVKDAAWSGFADGLNECLTD